MEIKHLETKDIEFLSDITIDEEIVYYSSPLQTYLDATHTQYSFWQHKEPGNRQFLFTLDKNMFNKIFKINEK
jgi:hypothetical protein